MFPRQRAPRQEENRGWVKEKNVHMEGPRSKKEDYAQRHCYLEKDKRVEK